MVALRTSWLGYSRDRAARNRIQAEERAARAKVCKRPSPEGEGFDGRLNSPKDRAGAAGWWQPQMEGFMTGNHFTRNIFYNTDDSPKVIHRHIGFTTEPLSDAVGVSGYNVFFSAGGAGFTIRESSSPLSDMEESERTYPLWPKYEEIPLEEWRKMGFDTHSVVADPLFVDPTTDDFRLKPDSPALKLGFQPIDQSKIGPREKP